MPAPSNLLPPITPPARRVPVPERRPPTEEETRAAMLHSAVRQAVANYEHCRAVARNPAHPNYPDSPRSCNVAERLLRMAMTAAAVRHVDVGGIRYTAIDAHEIGRGRVTMAAKYTDTRRAGA